MFNLNDRDMNREIERARDEEHCGTYYSSGNPFDDHYDDSDYELDRDDYEHAEETFGLDKKAVDMILSVDLTKEDNKGDVEMTTTTKNKWLVMGNIERNGICEYDFKGAWSTTTSPEKAINNVKSRLRKNGITLSDPKAYLNGEMPKKITPPVAPRKGAPETIKALVKGEKGIATVKDDNNNDHSKTIEVVTRLNWKVEVLVGKALVVWGFGYELPIIRVNNKKLANNDPLFNLVLRFLSSYVLAKEVK